MSKPTSRAVDRSRPLAQKKVVLGVTGGIAAYKAVELTRRLSDEGAEVHVIMTKAAREFVGELTFQTLSEFPVSTNLFDLTHESEIGHIRLADDADLILIAPASADSIARLAAGLADDLLATVVLASRAPVLIAPAMNINMWENPLTQRNCHTLRALGHFSFVGPGVGDLACGWVGAGRLSEIADIVAAAKRCLSVNDLTGFHIAVTAGPTIEPLDPVRYIGNFSSGKMGFAIAAAAAQRGAAVDLITGPVFLATPPGVTRIDVRTTAEMLRAVEERQTSVDVLVMAAAVADYRAESVAAHKRTKESEGDTLQVSLVRNPDILSDIANNRKQSGRLSPTLVGFAAETPGATGDLVAMARKKMQRKGCDLIVANDVSESGVGFGGDDSEVFIVSESAEVHVARAPKQMIAHEILDAVIRYRPKRG